MELPPLFTPHVHSQPTVDTAIWLLHLRWVAVAGQLLTIAGVHWGLHVQLPLLGLFSLIGTTALSNTFYSLWLEILLRGGLKRSDRLPSHQVVEGLMVLDMLVLTGMLLISSGTANPFALFYFVNIAVAGVILTPLWAWGLWLIAVGGISLLLTCSWPLMYIDGRIALSDTQTWSIPKLGYLVSFITCGGVITYFITVLTGELKRREIELQAAESERLRGRQLEALGTLAAGAGHELATPLSTIAVVAKELSRNLDKLGVSEPIKRDVALIRSELDHCRRILDRMSSAAGDAAGERFRSIGIEEFCQEILLGIREPQRVKILISEETKSVENLLPVQATAQALRNIVQNAIDASQPGAEIQLHVHLCPEGWRMLVTDHGDGMTPEVLQRVGEPFFTTKEPGRGMGLGLYLTRNVLQRLDGRLSFTSRIGHGTTAEVILPSSRKSSD